MRASLLAVLALGLLPFANAAPPPVATFTNYAKYEIVTVSPRGTYLAITRREDKNEMLTVLTPDMKIVSQTRFAELLDIERLEWANDGRLLLQPSRRFPGLRDAKLATGEIFGIDADGKNGEVLFGFAAGRRPSGTHVKRRESTFAPARLLARLPNDPENVLIQTYGYGIGVEYNSVYRMNVNTGDLDELSGSPVRDGSFITDFDHRVALVYGRNIAGRAQAFYRSAKATDWKLLETEDDDGGSTIPVAPWSRSGEFLTVSNRDAPTRGVFLFTPETGASKLLFRQPDADISEHRLDPSGKPWMFTYQQHFPEFWYPDPQHPLAMTHRWLGEKFPGFIVDITSSTDDMAFVVARMSRPRNPPVYFYVDAKQPKVLLNLATYPDLKSQDLAEVEPIEFKARDGLAVRGYLTVPNVPEKKKLPLIVMIHGGPHYVFDLYEFNSEAQLLASRGYAVLQVNYRGSGGRGRAFMAAGYREWGRAMQDDITDAVKWAIGDGVADPKRICIYGGSYGAYAALTGAFREPDMFRCAVGMAGVYDLPLMFDEGDIPNSARGVHFLEQTLGTDMEELKRRSPVYNAEKIRAAVLLIHGRADARAPYEHAIRMRAALEKAGNPPEWIVETGEGHGFFNQKNRADAYERILEFLAKHLAPPAAGS
jgi:dipeptidyl aminopeptidase/acylaminoacyl peptidase